jgi:hypothetical protein
MFNYKRYLSRDKFVHEFIVKQCYFVNNNNRNNILMIGNSKLT